MHRMSVGLAIAALLAATSPAISVSAIKQTQPTNARTPGAQEKKQSEDSQTKAPVAGDQSKDQIQLKARLVSMTVTVLDPLGRFVTGLDKRNFQVFDDGVKQEITHFSDDDAPLTLGIIYQGRHQKKALLIISDGEENSSRYSGRELREMLTESDVPVYAIGISQLYAGMGTLQSLSGWSGGMTFAPADEPQTRDIYTRIALMLRHQYAIGFYPTDAASPVDWHKVRINVSAPRGLGRLSLNYKKGYRSFVK
jgi:hypothetical protein